jgi:hypothetical protein
MPHGSMIAGGRNATVLTGGSFLIGSSTTEVAAYRSVVLVIGESNGRNVEITIQWTFYDSSGDIHPTETKVATGGKSTRLLFQNKGDLIETISAVAIGGNTTVDWYLTGSNLDPLPSSAPDYLLLQGAGQNVVQPPVGDSDHAKFTLANRQTNDDSLWTYVLDGAGDIKEIQTSALGRYLLFAQGEWRAAAGSYDKIMLINTFGTGGFGLSPAVRIQGAAEQLVFLGSMEFVTGGTLQINVQVSIDIAGPVVFVCDYFWIYRWAT